MIKALLAVATLPAILLATGASAQDNSDAKEPRRVRVGLGPQVQPRYPGGDDVRFTPLYDLSVTRGDKPFEFDAADQSSSFALVRSSGFAIGPAVNVEGSRRRDETDLPVDEVGISVEAGGFAQVWLGPIRARGELRQGITGHKALVGNVMLDYVAREGDKWLFSIGPRIALSDGKYQDAYFGVNPAAAARTGLPVYNPGGGLYAAGASATTIYQFDPHWGVYGYAKYDRLVADAARSPIVRTIGSRNQFSGGLALTYTFGLGR